MFFEPFTVKFCKVVDFWTKIVDFRTKSGWDPQTSIFPVRTYYSTYWAKSLWALRRVFGAAHDFQSPKYRWSGRTWYRKNRVSGSELDFTVKSSIFVKNQGNMVGGPFTSRNLQQKTESWSSGGLCAPPRVLGVCYIERVAKFQIVEKKMDVFFF